MRYQLEPAGVNKGARGQAAGSRAAGPAGRVGGGRGALPLDRRLPHR